MARLLAPAADFDALLLAVRLVDPVIHGPRSVLRTAASKNDRMSRRVTHIAQTRHQNIAAVALANKKARIAWAMMTKGTDYQPGAVAV